MYRSRFGASGPISLQQYLAEVFCARQARLQGRTLPQQFWKDPAWGRLYRLQVMLAAGLLARFDPRVVTDVLRSQQGLSICTGRNPRLVALLEAETERRTRRQRLSETLRGEAEAGGDPGAGAGGPTPPAADRPPIPRPGSLFDSLG